MYAYVSHACLVYMEARRGHWISQNWSSMFVSHRVVQGSNLGPQEEQPVLSTTEPSPQSNSNL